jgi:hypothetical protein
VTSLGVNSTPPGAGSAAGPMDVAVSMARNRSTGIAPPWLAVLCNT